MNKRIIQIHLAALILVYGCSSKKENVKVLYKLPGAEQYLDMAQSAADSNQLDSAKMWFRRADSAFNVKPYALIELQKKISKMEDSSRNRNPTSVSTTPETKMDANSQ